MEHYRDCGRAYLELHAERAPIYADGYYADMGEGAYESAVQDAISDFEDRFGVEIYCLGRSGRHVCIEDTPENRRRYPNLQRAALAAVRRLWNGMRSTAR